MRKLAGSHLPCAVLRCPPCPRANKPMREARRCLIAYPRGLATIALKIPSRCRNSAPLHIPVPSAALSNAYEPHQNVLRVSHGRHAPRPSRRCGLRVISEGFRVPGRSDRPWCRPSQRDSKMHPRVLLCIPCAKSILYILYWARTRRIVTGTSNAFLSKT